MIEDVQNATDEDLVSWVKEHYELICAACDDRNIPRPPPWRDIPLP